MVATGSVRARYGGITDAILANQAEKSAKVWLVACLQNSWADSFGQNGGGFQFDLRLMMNVKISKFHAS